MQEKPPELRKQDGTGNHAERLKTEPGKQNHMQPEPGKHYHHARKDPGRDQDRQHTPGRIQNGTTGSTCQTKNRRTIENCHGSRHNCSRTSGKQEPHKTEHIFCLHKNYYVSRTNFRVCILKNTQKIFFKADFTPEKFFAHFGILIFEKNIFR